MAKDGILCATASEGGVSSQIIAALLSVAVPSRSEQLGTSSVDKSEGQYDRVHSDDAVAKIRQLSEMLLTPGSFFMTQIARLIFHNRANAKVPSPQSRFLNFILATALLPSSVIFSVPGLMLRLVERPFRDQCRLLVNDALSDLAANELLRIYTYNIAAGGDGLNARNHMMPTRYRIQAIIKKILIDAEKINKNGIFILQEVWCCQEDLLAALCNNFKYIYYNIGEKGRGFFTGMNSGKMVFSNHPLEFKGYHSFHSRTPLQGFAERGFVELSVDFNGKEVGVFGTHLESCDDKGSDTIRCTQLERMIKLAKTNYPNGAIIAGDLNIAGVVDQDCLDESGNPKSRREPGAEKIMLETDDFVARAVTKAGYKGPSASFFNMGLVKSGVHGEPSKYEPSTVSTPHFNPQDLAHGIFYDRVLTVPPGAFEGEAHIIDGDETVKGPNGIMSAPSDHLAVMAQLHFRST